MKLNYQKVAKMAGSMLGLDQKRLDDAISKASSVAGGIRTKNDALNVLKKNGIDKSFLSKVQGMVNGNPMASRLAGMMGVDLNEIRRGLSDLQGSSSNPPASDGDERIEQMKKRLERAKKL